ncbi:hypothetical protein ACT691_09885 [Vibrio metschnikovii]
MPLKRVISDRQYAITQNNPLMAKVDIGYFLVNMAFKLAICTWPLFIRSS